jgi:hypothetical protein
VAVSVIPHVDREAGHEEEAGDEEATDRPRSKGVSRVRQAEQPPPAGVKCPENTGKQIRKQDSNRRDDQIGPQADHERADNQPPRRRLERDGLGEEKEPFRLLDDQEETPPKHDCTPDRQATD